LYDVRIQGRGFLKSEIWNQEIWDLEIGRFLHLKAEIIDLESDDTIEGAILLH